MCQQVRECDTQEVSEESNINIKFLKCYYSQVPSVHMFLPVPPPLPYRLQKLCCQMFCIVVLFTDMEEKTSLRIHNPSYQLVLMASVQLFRTIMCRSMDI
jgi:hypothetical protein